MASQENQTSSHEQSVRKRVRAKISTEAGYLEDQSLDLDARTLALLGKRQQLRVKLNNGR